MSFLDKLKAILGLGKPAEDERTDPATDDAANGAPAPASDDSETELEASGVEIPYETPTEIAERRRTTPAEDARLDAEGRALFDQGDAERALTLLAERGILFARHEITSLPCLCRRCLRPDEGTAASGGVAYVRDFVVTKHRVLFYWMPAELVHDAKHVRASMRSEVKRRLRSLASKPEVINPFTRQPITPVPRRERRLNPFTGKPVL